MLLAQLHHKVPREFEGMEDVLTSSVLGLLKYLPAQVACALLAGFASVPLPRPPLQVELWPRYPTPPGFRSADAALESEAEPASRGDTEPDAVITTPGWLVLVEAKYHVTRRVLVGPAWYGQGPLERAHRDSCISFTIHGAAVRLADLPDSEAVAEKIVEPVLEMYRERGARH